MFRKMLDKSWVAGERRSNAYDINFRKIYNVRTLR